MKSTGEVMGVGDSFGEAFAKASLAAGERLPDGGRALVSVKDSDKPFAARLVKDLHELGFKLVATRGTARLIEAQGIACAAVNKVTEGRPDVADMLKNEQIDLIVNTTEGRQSIADSAVIRRLALLKKVCYTTTLAGGEAVGVAIRHQRRLDKEGGPVTVRRLQDVHSALGGGSAEPGDGGVEVTGT